MFAKFFAVFAVLAIALVTAASAFAYRINPISGYSPITPPTGSHLAA